jgi:predicted aminopeptidase
MGFISAISGCSTISYYGHVTKGHLSIIKQREDIDTLLENHSLDEKLRRQLQLVSEARQFAVDQLQLPDNDSYLKYVDLQRPYVVWNVFAADELSLTAKQHCFPVAGCVVYRGYYSEEAAKQAAESLSQQGYDIHVAGVAAYSTLGWFDDPLLSSMLLWEDWAIVQLIFHELSHQKLYLKNDSGFNEALATAASQLGLDQWHEAKQQTELIDRIQNYRERQQQFNSLLLATRSELDRAYKSVKSDQQKREAKVRIIESLREDYHQLKISAWDSWAGYDRWFEQPINNARLLPMATYNSRVPEFVELFSQCAADWGCFWQAAEELSQQTTELPRE